MAINKGKLKRIKKDLEKLLSQGKYWEFLQLVEAEAVGDSCAQDVDLAWRALVRAAFTSAESLRSFLVRIKSVKTPPTSTDITFLLLVDRFMDGENVATEVAALKNLSPMPHAMQKRLLSWRGDVSGKSQIEAQFDFILSQPDKVTKKHLAEVIRCIPGCLGSNITSVVDYFETVRKFNLKSSIAKKRNGVDPGELSFLDDDMKDLGTELPMSLFRIIVTPILYQLSLVYKNYCRDDRDFALEICSDAPFLTECLTGTRWHELEKSLLEFDFESLYESNPALVRDTIATADFSEKVKLLKHLSTSLAEMNHEEFDPFDGLYDDDDDDDFDKKEMNADYLLLYKNILKEIGTTRATLPLRDQKELSQVMGEILHRDFGKFFADPAVCPEFLKAVALSGCLDTRLALTCILITRVTGDRSLREQAERALEALSPPVVKDVVWLLDHFISICYPNISTLYPVMRYVRENEAIIDLIVGRITTLVTGRLTENAMFKGMEKSPFSAFMGGFSPKKAKEEMTLFRRDLSNFKEIAGFAHLIHMADCFPEGSMTESGFKKMLAERYFRNGITGVIEVIKGVLAQSKVDEFERNIIGTLGGEDLVLMQSNSAITLLNDHLEDLRSTPLESFKTLMDFLEKQRWLLDSAPFLVRISTIAHERKAAGETAFEPIIAKLSAIILKLAKKPKSSGRKKR